jgi:hypothetical protein
MKKVFTIIFSVIILAAGANLSFAIHTCHAHLSGYKLSLTDELAGCGMESDNSPVPTEGALKSDCCRDRVSHLRVDENFNPSFSTINDLVRDLTQVFTVPATVPLPSEILSYQTIAHTGPPDGFYASSVRLASICIFRI